MFVLAHGQQHVIADGVAQHFRCADIDALEAASRAVFARLADQPAESSRPPAMLVGALPFDRKAAISLHQPQRFRHLAAPLAATPAGRRIWSPLSTTPQPDTHAYADAVRAALARIAAGDIEKVVLARSLKIRASVAVDPLTVAGRLATADPAVTTFCVTLPAASDSPHITPCTLVGATPELLIRRRGQQVFSHPLAGSAARSADNVADRAAGQALLNSAKDQREHALVVEAILDQLAPHCRDLGTPDGTILHSTATMWHLGTRIHGRLKPEAPSAAGLAALLHPTPAVGGTPRDAAIDLIAELEPEGRGFYAGAVGFVDAAGDGEWHVALRCAEICGSHLTLHAGAGIVAGSDPAAEVAETQAKFAAMLRGLDMDAQDDLKALAS